jgi:hypothetical protein
MCEFVDCDITPHRTAFVDVYEYSDFVWNKKYADIETVYVFNPCKSYTFHSIR